MSGIKELAGERIVIADGAMGTQLQRMGLAPGELPELWNAKRPEDVRKIHKAYYEAGADFVLSNTFGGNRCKLADSGAGVGEIVSAGLDVALRARDEAMSETGKRKFAALDIGPTGKLITPAGGFSFDEAFEVFGEVVKAGSGADFIMIETMGSTLEMKAAVLAAKEFSRLPVFVTAVFDVNGKTLTGADVRSVVTMLEGLGADAIGINCGLGPDHMMPLLEKMYSYASVPLIVKPNAGMPRIDGRETVYDVGPEAFAESVSRMAASGARIAGGCCGTSPEYIKRLACECAGVRPKPVVRRSATVVCSGSEAVEIGCGGPTVVGERINPTGKKRLKQALREGDMGYIVSEGFSQRGSGAQVLDVNAGLPEIDEASVLTRIVCELQSVISLPLQIDTSDAGAMEAALRVYDGKAMINSVNGKEASMETVFPLVKKYGGVVVGLTLDESGIPDTVQGRVDIARRIIERAEACGIDRKDVVIDTLCMSIGTNPMAARVTLEAMRAIRAEFGVHTILGVSNISFGLPARDTVNASFFTMAMEAGLGAAIINPGSEAMRNALSSWKALSGLDPDCSGYVAMHGEDAANAVEKPGRADAVKDLKAVVVSGMKSSARAAAENELRHRSPMEIIDGEIIPALDEVGRGFGEGKIFLPQLLMSAEAARLAFESISAHIAAAGGSVRRDRGCVVLATVKGDIHDIGKNIVRALLENYGFDVHDLGKDVSPEDILSETLSSGARLVGLSALMTTTVGAMSDTVRLLHEKAPSCRVMVGGAVLTAEYARVMGADHYSADAMDSVRYACTVYGK